MTKEIFKYIKKIFSQKPEKIDRLIVSTFLHFTSLNTRKNVFIKSYQIRKTETVEYKKLQDFINFISGQKIKINFEGLIELFEFVISPADRVVNGAVYTPKFIRNFIIRNCFKSIGKIEGDIKFCDPACGCGGFLYTVAKKIKKVTGKSYYRIFKENIFGIDIQEYSVIRSQLLLSLLALSEGEDVKEFKFNLFKGNTLNFNWKNKIKDFAGFDIVAGNPPYVSSRNIDEESKTHLSKWEVCSTGHPDLYIPFFQIGLEYLKFNGILGYITMNTFFKSVNGRALRNYFQRKNYVFSILDFGDIQIFQSKSTYTCLCFIQNKKSKYLKYSKLNDIQALKKYIPSKKIPYQSLNTKNGWNLQNIDLINKIESTGYPFEFEYLTRNGIATLKNGIYIFDPIKEDNDYFYLQNGSLYPIEKAICRDIINPNKLTKVDCIASLTQKIIFPYQLDRCEKAILIPEKKLKNSYPKAYKYLEDKRNILKQRDKGNMKYSWYAFGRNQSLEKLKNKLFFPHITSHTPNFVLNTNENLLFYNGIAVVGKSKKELLFLKKLMSSRLFWFYIINTSKPYGSGYYSLSRNYIKTFGVYQFTKEEKEFLIKENDQKKIDSFIESRYKIQL